MKRNTILTLLLLVLGSLSWAQISPDHYYIQFTDKNNSPYSIDNPQEFLSQRAIDRRARFGIVISEEDLPVNPDYLSGVTATGATLMNPTKWMNGVTIYTADPSVVAAILALPYVESTVKLAQGPASKEKEYFRRESFVTTPEGNTLAGSRSADYGFAGPQITQINGVPLHDGGFMGQGMVIAVLDGGFSGTDEHPFFDSLWADNRVLGTYDFVHPGESVFTESGHGNSVLSTMAAYAPGQMIGTAPLASYYLLRSEDVMSENVIEEYNWVSAAEFADSVGADVINSSLGYIDFDNPVFDHTYEDMDGMTNVSTRGADKAFSKGIMVVNSAGNSGGNAYPYIGAPADGFNVLSIGAVDPFGNRAYFSSIGPTYDGRVKPDIDATGQSTFVAYGSTDAGYGNGTSFSSPIIAGMTACLIQAHPQLLLTEIQDALRQSGNQSFAPDNLLGWGIPNYQSAGWILTSLEESQSHKGQLVDAYPNPSDGTLHLKVNLDSSELIRVSLFGPSGKLIYTEEIMSQGVLWTADLSSVVAGLSSGLYLIRLEGPVTQAVTKVVVP